jgi:hypothetical protein
VLEVQGQQVSGELGRFPHHKATRGATGGGGSW